MNKDVSPSQGHDSLATSGVQPTHVPFTHSSRPTLFSQYRGPRIYNETEEARQAREEAERKAKEDEEKKSNFKKVQEKAEREEEARKAAEAERDQLRKEKEEREEAERKAAEAKLEEDKQFEQLAKQREDEARAKGEEAEAAKKRADAAEAKVKEFEDAQEAELKELLDSIPEEKRPPIDDSDPVSKRLTQVKYVKALLDEKQPPKPPVGGQTPRQGGAGADARIAELKAKPMPTKAELFELMELTKKEE